MRSRRRPRYWLPLLGSCHKVTEGECFFILSFRRTPCATFPTGEGFLLYGHLSVSQSGAFSDCATRFRGGALRHAKFPKTSYKVQLLDTLKHGRCVNPDHSRGRGLIFLSKKVLVLVWQNASVLLVCPSSPQSGASPQGEADKVPFSIFLTFIRNDTARQQERRGFIFLPKHMCISIYKKTAVRRFFVFYFP